MIKCDKCQRKVNEMFSLKIETEVGSRLFCHQCLGESVGVLERIKKRTTEENNLLSGLRKILKKKKIVN